MLIHNMKSALRPGSVGKQQQRCVRLSCVAYALFPLTQQWWCIVVALLSLMVLVLL